MQQSRGKAEARTWVTNADFYRYHIAGAERIVAAVQARRLLQRDANAVAHGAGQ